MTKLTQSERETAQQLLAGGWSIVRVARAMKRHRVRKTRAA